MASKIENSWFRTLIGNHVFANMLMLGFIFLGSYAYLNIRLSLYPDVNHAWYQIVTQYPGAQAELVEEDVTNKIEDKVRNIDDVDLTMSTTMDGSSIVYLRARFEATDLESIFQEIIRNVNHVELPETAQAPKFLKVSYSSIPILSIAVFGRVKDTELVRAADQLKNRLDSVNGISELNFLGKGERKINVEVDPQKLNQYSLSMEEINAAIRINKLEAPGGVLELDQKAYLLRVKGQINDIASLKEVVVKTDQNKAQIRIKDIAVVNEVLDEDNVLCTYEGEPAIVLNVHKSKSENSIRIIRAIKKKLEPLQLNFIDGVQLAYFADTSIDIKKLMGVLESSSWMGLLLVFVVLWLFIGLRQAFFAALGIPVAFGFTIICLYYSNLSLNQMTLFAMVLVLGMVVDDAIVVIENIYEKMERGLSAMDATMAGFREIFVPVLSSVMTSMAAFLPLLLAGGPIGRVLKFIPIVVCLTLLGSLIECFLILPSHLADGARLNKKSNAYNNRLRAWVLFIGKKCLRKGGLLLVAVFLLSGFSLVYIASHGKQLFSNDDLRGVRVGLEMDPGMSKDDTLKIVKKCAEIAEKSYGSELGNSVGYSGIFEEDAFGSIVYWGHNMAQLFLELKPDASVTLNELIAGVKDQYAEIPGIKMAKYVKLENAPVAGGDIEIVIRGDNLEELKEASQILKNKIHEYDGTSEVRDNLFMGSSQIHLMVDGLKAAQLGLSKGDVSLALYRSFEGEKVGVLKSPDKDMDIVVVLQEKSRENLEDLKQLEISTPLGNKVRLHELAAIEFVQGPTAISHYNIKRNIIVTGKIDKSKLEVEVVNDELTLFFTKIETLFPDLTIEHTGAQDDIKRSFKDMAVSMLISVFLVYSILATQFKSFVQPFLIMFVIPVCMIGVSVSMIIGSNPLSLFIFIGVIGLSGVVVNDSLILIDYINKKIAVGYSLNRAILSGMARRARPIIFTTLTTVAGLLPAATGLMGRSLIWQPLAQTFIAGLLVATFATLFLLPFLYHFLYRISHSRKA